MPAWDIGAMSAQDKDGPLFDALAMAVTTKPVANTKMATAVAIAKT